MNIRQFLNYISYSTDCPSSVNPHRWRGMLKWFETRSKPEETSLPWHFFDM
jgi:hypothetical protein